MNKSQIFKAAHAQARKIVAIVGNYMVALSYSLKQQYAQLANSMQHKLEALGMDVWGAEFGKARMYINNDAQIAAIFGLQISRYKSGSIKAACLNGEKISNSKAYKLTSGKIYFDLASEKFMGIDLQPAL